MSFRDKLGIFVLTAEEQRTVAFVILALVLGLWTKHYRATHPPTEPPALESRQAHQRPTPSP